MTDDDWTWALAPAAAAQFEDLDGHIQDRVVSKLEEIVASDWREPEAVPAPLAAVVLAKRVARAPYAQSREQRNQ